MTVELEQAMAVVGVAKGGFDALEDRGARRENASRVRVGSASMSTSVAFRHEQIDTREG